LIHQKKLKLTAGHTCIKGRYAFSFYEHPDRLKTPLIKRNGKFEEASWDEAYDFIKKEMNRITKIMDLMHLLEFHLQDVLMKKTMFFKK
jgi:predicted molibdopterin-dependent oxidoreductase YjgC